MGVLVRLSIYVYGLGFGAAGVSDGRNEFQMTPSDSSDNSQSPSQQLGRISGSYHRILVRTPYGPLEERRMIICLHAYAIPYGVVMIGPGTSCAGL